MFTLMDLCAHPSSSSSSIVELHHNHPSSTRRQRTHIARPTKITPPPPSPSSISFVGVIDIVLSSYLFGKAMRNICSSSVPSRSNIVLCSWISLSIAWFEIIMRVNMPSITTLLVTASSRAVTAFSTRSVAPKRAAMVSKVFSSRNLNVHIMNSQHVFSHIMW